MSSFIPGTKTELVLANTTTNAGRIVLPSTFQAPGRVISIKDITGAFQTRPITISTITQSQQFEQSVLNLNLNDRFGSYTFTAGSNNQWYVTGGNYMNAATISSLTTQALSTFFLSTANATVSTITMKDISNPSTGTIANSTGLLFFAASNIWGGTKTAVPLFAGIRVPFVPTRIATVVLWLDGDDVNTIQSQSTVTRWFDKSSTRKIAVQNLAAPVYIPRGVNFNTTSALLNVSAMPSVGPFDIFIVGIPFPSSATYRTFLRSNSAPGTHQLLINTGSDAVGMWTSTVFNQFGSLTWTANEQAMFYISVSNTLTETASKNGTIALTAATAAGNEAQITCIGNSVGSGNQPGGIVNELLIFSNTLTTPQRFQIEGYLAWKWNLVTLLPSNHPFKNSPP